MSIDELLVALRAAGEHETYPPATAEDIAATERALAQALPGSFRRFQTEFSNGAYLFTVQEISATGAGHPQIGAIQNVRSHAIPASPNDEIPLDERGAVKASSLVPFSLDSNGNCWCFLTSDSAPECEYPVAYLVADQHRLVGRLPGFESWLTTLVNKRTEVIRAIHDWDELDLG